MSSDVEPLLPPPSDDEESSSGGLVEEGAPLWMTTFGDLMSLLLTFFVLLYSMSELKQEKFLQASQSLREAIGGSAAEIERGPEIAGCLEAQASLAAWASFEKERARSKAALAARLNRAWSPLSLLISLVPEE